MYHLKPQHALTLSRLLLATFLIWTGIMRFFAGDIGYYDKQLAEIGLDSGGQQLSYLIGILQFITALALLAPTKKWASSLLYLYAAAALVPMLMLLTHPVWIESMGGFPAIGAGQGLIKYLSIAGVSLYLAAYYQGNHKLQQISEYMILAGIILVLAWIGGMKFTLIEAQGIEPLLKTSPLFSWIYSLFDLMGGSIFIGVIELVAVAGLLFWKRHHRLFLLGAAISIITFASTQTFMLTLPGWHQELGFPFISGSGQFLLKDLPMLAGVLLLLKR